MHRVAICTSQAFTVRHLQLVKRNVLVIADSGHRLFLLDRNLVSSMTSENGPVEEFSVLGATATVYSVSVGKHPSCSCPDFQKGNICKHYLFVMLRVLRLDRSDPLVWQKALLKSEVLHTSTSTRLCFKISSLTYSNATIAQQALDAAGL